VTRYKRAFTLPELLIVLAIVSILASILYPVFRSAREAAYKTTCLANFKNLHFASSMYTADWDDRMMPVNHQPSAPANSSNDRTWVQLTLPYSTQFSIYNCPSDFGERPPAETTFDQDLVPGDTYSKYYSASLRVNAGYNYAYLAPVYRDRAGNWLAQPRTMSQVGAPSSTLLFVDSVWGRTESGQPFGGGSWLVVPPCRFEVRNGHRRDSFSIGAGNFLYTPNEGWEFDKDSAFVYGSAWPWHMGKVNIIRLDGSMKSISAEQLTTGCDARENWQGSIQDPSRYMWDLD